MPDHVDAPPELMPLEPCDCCGIPSSYRRGSLWHGRSLICLACFIVWYDPDKGETDATDPASIRRERLWRFGDGDVGRSMKEIPRAQRGPWPPTEVRN
jgi:hypothetical protein